jgi:hypothetical protein
VAINGNWNSSLYSNGLRAEQPFHCRQSRDFSFLYSVKTGSGAIHPLPPALWNNPHCKRTVVKSLKFPYESLSHFHTSKTLNATVRSFRLLLINRYWMRTCGILTVLVWKCNLLLHIRPQNFCKVILQTRSNNWPILIWEHYQKSQDYLPCYEQFQQPLVWRAIVVYSELGSYLTYATRRLRTL